MVRWRAAWVALLLLVPVASGEEAALPVRTVSVPGFGDCHWGVLLGGALLCLIQAGLIITLLMQRSKRRRAEAEATLVADLLSIFANLSLEEIDGKLVDAQRRICEILGIDFSIVWQPMESDPETFSPTHSYIAREGADFGERMNQDQYPWAREELLAGRTIAISSPQDLPPEAALDRETLLRYGIKSNLAMPLAVGNDPPIGILGLGTTEAHRDWPEGLVKRLQSVARIFAAALARKHARQALSASEERMNLAVEAAQFGLWEWDIARECVWGSQQWRRLFGFNPKEEFDYKTVIGRIHPDDREAVESEVRQNMDTRNSFEMEFRLLLPDGSETWIASRGKVHVDAEGTPVRMLGAAIDITKRRNTEEALRTSEARLQAGVDFVGLGYYEVDYEARSCWFDERFRSICGCPPEIHQGLEPVQFWLEHIHPDDRQRIQDEREKLHEGAVDLISAEYRYQHPSEGQRWLHHLARIGDRGTPGQRISSYGVMRDITHRKQAELENQELRSSLAHADRVTLLGQLASSLAHELSQPLGAILRNAEAAEIMLRQASPDLPELKAIIDDILEDDQRAGLVIGRLRSLLKRRSLNLEPVNMASMVEEVIQLVQPEAVGRHVRVDSSVPHDQRPVFGDRVHLQQVMLNLLINALEELDSCRPGGCHIHVESRQTDRSTIEISVSDTGPGISEECLPRLFEPFFTSKESGMGMGLAVSQTIIEAHHGKLWAENRPEGGAIFRFTLPVAQSAGSASETIA